MRRTHCSSQTQGDQVSNRRLLNGHRRRFQVWTITVGWLIGIVASLCVPARAQAPTAGITAGATTVAPGQGVRLTWTTQNAATAALNGVNVALNGTGVVYPTTTTAYTITAHSSTGATDAATVVVTVVSAEISAGATDIAPGQNVTLTWTTQNAATAALNGVNVALNGTSTVSPTTTTTYTITATSSTGVTYSVSVVVTVGFATLTASATTVAPGQGVTLTWTTQNAATAALNGQTVALNGTGVVYPTTSTASYTITATSSTGVTSTATVVVTVVYASITASEPSVAPGQGVTLTWTTQNAAHADLTGSGQVALNGTGTVYPTTTTAYTISATTSTGVTDASTVVVTVGANSGPSVAGQWTPVQTWPFMAAHAHLLANGEVLFWPSFDLGNNPTLWNPVTNTFSTPPAAAYNIFCSGHSFQPDGTLLVTGGHDGSSGYGYPYASIYDPVRNVWTQTSNMSNARWYPTNTTLANGDVLVVSGEITPGVTNTLPQIWHSATASWINLSSAQFQQPDYPIMFVAPNGQVFNAGPDQTTWYLNTSGTGAWTTVGNFNYNGTRDYGSAVIFDGKVLIAGGDGSDNSAATNTAEIIDLNASSPAWQFTSSMANPRRQANLTLLPDGKVLVTGGSLGYGFDNALYPVYPAEMWDPATGTWSTMASITTYRGYHSTALLLPDGRVLSAGGEETGASAEIYSPPYLFNGTRPSITSAPSSVKYGQAFFVATPNAASIGQVTWIRLGSVTHSFNQNQRLNHLQFAQASGGLNITAPASGNLAPPGHYMLFLVNSNGVPSVASIIQITN